MRLCRFTLLKKKDGMNDPLKGPKNPAQECSSFCGRGTLGFLGLEMLESNEGSVGTTGSSKQE